MGVPARAWTIRQSKGWFGLILVSGAARVPKVHLTELSRGGLIAAQVGLENHDEPPDLGTNRSRGSRCRGERYLRGSGQAREATYGPCGKVPDIACAWFGSGVGRNRVP